MFYTILCVGTGGFVGAILRFLFYLGFAQFFSQKYIFIATICVNIIGSFIIGFVLNIATTYAINYNFKNFLVTGLLGALTTFSTFTYENAVFLNHGEISKFFLNITMSIVLCLIFCFLGIYTAKIIH